MDHIQTIQDLYAAFRRGDVPTILDKLTPDVEWEYPESAARVPWLERRVGRDAVAGFFRALEAIHLERFELKEFLAGPNVVVVLLDVTFTVQATGRRVVEEDEIHVWRFDAQGRVARFKHGVDTHRHHLAYREGAV